MFAILRRPDFGRPLKSAKILFCCNVFPLKCYGRFSSSCLSRIPFNIILWTEYQKLWEMPASNSIRSSLIPSTLYLHCIRLQNMWQSAEIQNGMLHSHWRYTYFHHIFTIASCANVRTLNFSQSKISLHRSSIPAFCVYKIIRKCANKQTNKQKRAKKLFNTHYVLIELNNERSHTYQVKRV